MPSYVFVFCYETPAHHLMDPACEADSEETRAILIEAPSEALALRCGIQLARAYVKRVYQRVAGMTDFEWEPAVCRHWVESHPREKWSEEQLGKIPRVRVDGDFAPEGGHAIPA